MEKSFVGSKKKLINFLILSFVNIQFVTCRFLDIFEPNRSPKDIVFSLNLPWLINQKNCFNGLAGSGYNGAKYYASAAAVAVEDINKKLPLRNNYTLNFYWNENVTDTRCDDLLAVRSQLTQINQKVDAFLGYVLKCETLAKNAAAVNVPMISMSCSEPSLSNKKEFPTFARTTSINIDIIHMLTAMMDHYKWKKMAIFYEESHIWEPIYTALKQHIDDNKKTVDLEITLKASYEKIEAYGGGKYENLDHIFIDFLTKLPTKARIVFVLIEKGYLRRFLQLAEERGLNDGSYVYIIVHPFAMSHKLLSMEPPAANYLWILPWKGHKYSKQGLFQSNRRLLTKMFRQVFVLMPEQLNNTIVGKNHMRFQDRVRKLMSQPPFNEDTYEGYTKYSLEPKNKTTPPQEAERLYDSVMLYALGVNATLAKNESIQDGAAIVKNMKSLKFNSISGNRYVVNSNAEVQKYFNLYQFQFTDEQVDEIVASTFIGSKKHLFTPYLVSSMTPVCINTTCENLVFEMQFDSNTKPKWILGKPPPDEPKCGFDGKLCPDDGSEKSMVLAVAISCTLVVIVLLLIPVFLYRESSPKLTLLPIFIVAIRWDERRYRVFVTFHRKKELHKTLTSNIRNYRLKRQLKSQLWKIDPSDLFFHDWRSVSTSSLGSLTSQTLSINYETTTRQRFTSVAIYKGTLVAVKKINKRNMEMSKAVLMELKQIRDVRHDNLNQFIGACVEPNNVLIITQYASKGSLQDVLENPEIHLDTLFILSLVYDIIKGMLYLHSTDIKSHGNLKSSNCVIDSRWVLKITDFGLNTFKSKQGTINSIETESCNSLLWKAPELLRLNIPATSRGSQKGDVYSFSIILQECHTRDGAWGTSFQDAEAIIDRVKERRNPPFRPVVPELLDGAEALRDLMKKCWSENPEERPNFSELRKDVEVMMKANGLKTNIFDNMIYMMGKYSDDLEEIVEERTSSLIEEKHKVEALLERMLPKTVARQLMKGKEVEAESFDEVTIYFSDIIGFTNICSAITPMEVVSLLNNLYTMFDGVTKDYDVYKVETIGDAYMVVSGLPIRNGKQHAKEISLLALDIIENVKSMNFLPNKGKLKIRIGIHCGPVVAGVVGTTMPRYCLFGDTVNVASRMESTGEALRIHASSTVNDALVQLGGFHLQTRGLTSVKVGKMEVPVMKYVTFSRKKGTSQDVDVKNQGKGDIETFWLTGAEPHLIRKRTNYHSKEPYHSGNHRTLKDLLQDSPRLRHKLHLTPDYLPRTPNNYHNNLHNNHHSSLHENLQKKLRKNATSSHKHKNGISFAENHTTKSNTSKDNVMTCELIDFSQSETSGLLGNGFSSTTTNGRNAFHDTVVHNGSLPTNTSPL